MRQDYPGRRRSTRPRRAASDDIDRLRRDRRLPSELPPSVPSAGDDSSRGPSAYGPRWRNPRRQQRALPRQGRPRPYVMGQFAVFTAMAVEMVERVGTNSCPTTPASRAAAMAGASSNLSTSTACSMSPRRMSWGRIRHRGRG